MKFLTKINRNYFWTLLASFLVISISIFFILEKIIIEETKESLFEKSLLIKEQLKENPNISNIYPIIEIQVLKEKTTKKPTFHIRYIEDTLDDNELEPYIEYSSVIEVNNNYYSLKIRELVVEDEDLLLIITIVVLALFLIVYATAFFVNKKLINNIWKNFEVNLNELDNFNLDKPERLKLLPTNINEFDRLNIVLNSLTDKLSKDYLSLKEFTENASHEIQTPLAVIKMNLETVLQNDLPKDIFEKIYSSHQSAGKLQKINKGLLLLSKIDNQQFSDQKEIDLTVKIQEKLVFFKPLLETNNIILKHNLEQTFIVRINPMLADVLLNNLLSNAINHNVENGYITILAVNDSLYFSNSSNGSVLKSDEYFERFKKGNSTFDSTGLGLSIVKKIVDVTKLEIYLKQNEDIMMVTLIK